MSGVLKIDITESKESLKKLLINQPIGKKRERVQILYLLKTHQAETVGHLATVTGRHRVTISRWLSQYRQGGLYHLLEIGQSPGRTPLISEEVKKQLNQELLDPEGFDSYQEIQQWLKSVHDVEASYWTVHKTVRYQLKSKLKVPRPVNIKQEPGAVENFKKNCQS
ncbi:MAG: helix-turn-helix domain-containing protein [Xenococcaceae cyanobacterium MO_167.B52]|nr:helix-turn-helix domain-containing protein [Xenococcaceae cyanobacterium MO_167.B52]